MFQCLSYILQVRDKLVWQGMSIEFLHILHSGMNRREYLDLDLCMEIHWAWGCSDTLQFHCQDSFFDTDLVGHR